MQSKSIDEPKNLISGMILDTFSILTFPDRISARMNALWAG